MRAGLTGLILLGITCLNQPAHSEANNAKDYPKYFSEPITESERNPEPPKDPLPYSAENDISAILPDRERIRMETSRRYDPRFKEAKVKNGVIGKVQYHRKILN